MIYYNAISGEDYRKKLYTLFVTVIWQESYPPSQSIGKYVGERFHN
jgi:hypothetical protein